MRNRSPTSTWWRSTRGTCGARSTVRSAEMLFRPCAGRATDSRPTAVDHGRRSAVGRARASASSVVAAAQPAGPADPDHLGRAGAGPGRRRAAAGQRAAAIPHPRAGRLGPAGRGGGGGADRPEPAARPGAGGVRHDHHPGARRPGPDHRRVGGRGPAGAAAAGGTGQDRMLSGPPLGMPSPLRVVAVGADDGQVVVAAVSFAQASDSIATVARAVFIGTPLLFGLVALAIWLVTGYTLRPIAGLRRGAAEVTQTGIPRHLPVPPARDEVRSLAVTLNDMLSRLADAQQRQRDLVSDTAHELRSPIASIRAQLEVALDHPDGVDWAETAQDVHAETLRLARLAENLLLLARLDDQR